MHNVLYLADVVEDVAGSTEIRAPAAKTHQMISSPKLNSPKLSYSPKLTSRETTHVNQINVGDFANLREGSSRQSDATSANQNVPDFKYQKNKIRFKGASNSVPNYNDKQENIKKTVVAQNDALLTNMSSSGSSSNRSKKSRAGKPPIYVSKIEPITAQKSPNFLLPTTVPHRNKFMDLLLGDTGRSDISTRSSPDSLPRINFGSPTPLQKYPSTSTADDYMTGEISIIVPKLPHLNKTQTEQSLTDIDSKFSVSGASADHHTEDEPIVIVTNEDGVNTTHDHNGDLTDRDGWESGYSSMSPRLSSLDSRAHAIMTPMSSITAGSVLLELPTSDHRSLTPFSTITNSTNFDHSRPQSSFLDVPQFIGAAAGSHFDTHESHNRRFFPESRPPLNKLPAIYSRNTNDSTDCGEDQRFEFTPLPLQSIRTSDGELSD